MYAINVVVLYLPCEWLQIENIEIMIGLKELNVRFFNRQEVRKIGHC